MKQKAPEYLNPQERQGEFFAEFEITGPKKKARLFRQNLDFGKKFILNLSYENLVFFSIVFIMLLVVFFSLGVEKGKRTVLQSTTEKDRRVVKREDETVLVNKKLGEEAKIIQDSSSIEKKEITASPKPYTIQVVAFKNEENAKKEMRHLKDEGRETFLLPSKEWLQVCVGRYAKKEEAEGDLAILRKRYPTGYIRKIE